MRTAIFRFIKQLRIDDGGCWRWVGALSSAGYGNFVDSHKNWRAHRWSYEYFKKKIPVGMVIDHMCRIRNCVNPDHLRITTLEDNSRRAIKPTK